jgi:hypothetical protein
MVLTVMISVPDKESAEVATVGTGAGWQSFDTTRANWANGRQETSGPNGQTRPRRQQAADSERIWKTKIEEYRT